MRHATFVQCIEKLKTTYSEKSYPEPRVRMIQIWASKIDDELFKQIVDKLIAENITPPMLPKFKDAYMDLRSFVRQKKINCIYCDGSGFILNNEDRTFPGTAYACKCDAGQRIPEYVGRWRGEFVRSVPTDAELKFPLSDTSKIISPLIK